MRLYLFLNVLSFVTITYGLVCAILVIDGMVMDGIAGVVSLILPHTEAVLRRTVFKTVHLVRITGSAKY